MVATRAHTVSDFRPLINSGVCNGSMYRYACVGGPHTPSRGMNSCTNTEASAQTPLYRMMWLRQMNSLCACRPNADLDIDLSAYAQANLEALPAGVPSYLTAAVGPPTTASPRRFCSVCGNLSS